MSTHTAAPQKKWRWIVPMAPRSPEEAHRASTPLELFFDLVFVVAVAQAASHLHHGIAEAHVAETIIYYAMVFFAIWWAWINFTWFASAYDNDDVPYRLMVFVQLIGSLILAAGVPQVFEGGNFPIVTLGYTLMRIALVTQWLRAAHADPTHRTTSYRYAIGVTLVQIGWIALLAVPVAFKMIGFITLVILELLVPIWAEHSNITTWHAGHITERYGLFTIIVLGESILSALIAIQSAIQAGNFSAALAAIIFGGLLIVLVMWWLYFDQPEHHLRTSARATFVWGYGHLFIFAAAAAVGAGLAVAVDYSTHHAEIDSFGAGAAVAIPVAIYLISLWLLQERPFAGFTHTLLFPACAILILLTPLTGQAVLLTGLLLSVLLAIKLTLRSRDSH